MSGGRHEGEGDHKGRPYVLGVVVLQGFARMTVVLHSDVRWTHDGNSR